MKKLFLLSVLLTFLFSCGTTMKHTWSKPDFTGKSFKKIAVIVVSKDNQVRSVVEQEIIANLKKQGIDAIGGYSLLSPAATKEDWQSEAIASKLQDLGVDGAIGISLINIRDRTEYVHSDIHHFPGGYARYGNYIYRSYSYVHSPSYYRNTKEYIIESNLYDVSVTTEKEEALLWHGQSSLYDPNGLNQAADSYAKDLVNYMIKNEIIETQKNN